VSWARSTAHLITAAWAALALAAVAIFSSYHESDAIGAIADLLGRQRGFTQSQIGDLTAVISLPNILLAVFNGLLIDRFGAARVTLWAAVIGFCGAVLTAIGTPYALMWTGRLIFGVSEGAIFISLVAGLAQWFSRSGIALATALFLCLARVGSFCLDTSPSWARPLYEDGWQPPAVARRGHYRRRARGGDPLSAAGCAPSAAPGTAAPRLRAHQLVAALEL
jgi:MFS family permease